MSIRYVGLAGLVLIGASAFAQQAPATAVPLRGIGTTHQPARLGTAPVNDQCNQVAPEALEAGATLTFTGTTTGATINGDYAEGSILFGIGVPVVWVAFTTTEELDVTIDYCGSASVFIDYWNILSTECPATDALVVSPLYDDTACTDNNPTVYFNALPAGTYYYPVWSEAGSADGPYTIHVIAADNGPVGPENDLCTGATPAQLDAGSEVSFSGDNTGATDSEGLGYASVWEAFTLTSCATVTVDFCGTGFEVAANQLYTSCPVDGSVTPSSTDHCPDGEAIAVYEELAPGTYYVPVRMEPGTAEGAYTFAVRAVACAVLNTAKDLCGDVSIEPLTVGHDVTFNGNNEGATADGDALEESLLFGQPLVWHAFEINACANVTVGYCGTDPLFTEVLGLLVADCPANEVIEGSLLDDCLGGGQQFAFENMAPGVYYVPVLKAAGASGNYVLTVSTTACAITNDECDSAAPLTVLPDCAPVGATLEGATSSMDPVDCGNGTAPTANDVWFSFQATQVEHYVRAQGAGADLVMEGFKDVCGALSSIGCADGTTVGGEENMTLSGLEPGSIYHVRVYHAGETAPADNSFGICVFGDLGTGVAETVTSGNDLYPNPTSGDLTYVHGGASGTFTIDALDMTGRRLMGERLALAHGQRTTLQWTGRLAQGSYLLRVSDGATSVLRPFLVK